ncbi:protein of unknown function DUF188 [Desulfarculus baarsii DSM 2075]|uniref:UPF0178 protein Deba_1561 n=1 Tax=Desulfarculus baarsii (strain ATCC 33931 / DSM 2075 / LMG 7858 / VKM B-1802 / 2st14) TaxID=644282 RepID=E1QH86_DESB2|nr:YaiI/YqxD family protein [Desulfarculus baarsii]ADK84929.1 protein of unknown function DUF188 [Desulfarculus baarsii DSM 2075]
MKIWIDADGCPKPAKELVFRASARLAVAVVMVADRPVFRPPSPLITAVVVPRDMDSADKHIAQEISPGDLVVTADLPLAAAVVERGAVAINPRGETYTAENVRERLSMRDFLTGLREAGVQTGGPAPYGRKDKERFAAALDRHLGRMGR